MEDVTAIAGCRQCSPDVRRRISNRHARLVRIRQQAQSPSAGHRRGQGSVARSDEHSRSTVSHVQMFFGQHCKNFLRMHRSHLHLSWSAEQAGRNRADSKGSE